MQLYLDFNDVTLPVLTMELPDHDSVLYLEVEELEWFAVASAIADQCGPIWMANYEVLVGCEYTEALWLHEILSQITDCLDYL